MSIISRPLPTTASCSPADPLQAAIGSAAGELAAIALDLEPLPFCARHGDPFSDGSCVEHDIDGRTEITELVGTCRRAASLVASAAHGHPAAIARLESELEALRVAHRRLAETTGYVADHRAAPVFEDAIGIVERLLDILDAAVHA